MKKSAGILLFRIRDEIPEVFLMHPGGPFWQKKDLGVWSIPKGEIGENENELEAAKREFQEETGMAIQGNVLALKSIRQKSGKVVVAWAVEQDIDISQVKSNSFEMEWPPKSGKIKSFPEMDRAEWFSFKEARSKMITGQVLLLEELEEIIKKSLT